MPPGATKSQPRLRVVVDTNAWVSRFLNPHSLVARRLGRLLRNRRVDLLFSHTLQAEILEVIQRPKFKKYITASELRLYVRRVKSYALTPVSSRVAVCRDAKDNFLLALCQDGNADFLLTGDQDLLVLQQFHRTRILTWAEAATELSL